MTFLYAFIFRVYYFNWCKVYQFFQRLFTAQYQQKKKVVIDNLQTAKAMATDPINQYFKLWGIYPKIKWKRDTWYMLGDVISDPYLMLYRGDDCDNFALLGYKMFGNNITDLDKHPYVSFKFRALYYMMFAPVPFSGGHSVAVWENSNGGMYVVSNQVMKFFESEAAMLKWAADTWSPVEYIIEGSAELKYIKTRKVL